MKIRKHNTDKADFIFEMLTKSRDTRIMLFHPDNGFERGFYWFCYYYFSDTFKYEETADFQFEFCENLYDWKRNLVFIGFRECAKTAFIKYYVIYCIIFRINPYLVYICNDASSAKSKLFDVVYQLQTNRKLLADFWPLFNAWTSSPRQKVQKKTISQFITENEVKVEALGMKQSLRGRVYGASDGEHRPWLLIFDDVDVEDSVKNWDIINNTYNKIKKEFFWWASKTSRKIFLWNVLGLDSVIQRMFEDYKHDPKRRCMRVAVKDEQGKISRSRYVETDEEAEFYNQDIEDPLAYRVSLDSERRDMGEIAYNQNYMLVPYNGTDAIVQREWIRYYSNLPELDYIQVGVDPASSEKTHTDRCGIIVTGFSWTNKYILEAVKLQGQQKHINNVLETIEYLYQFREANLVLIESVAYQNVLGQLLRDKNVACNEITPHKDKVTRLLEYQADFQNGRIFFKDDGSMKWLVDELLFFPMVSHDDGVDAMVYSFKKRDYSWMFS